MIKKKWFSINYAIVMQRARSATVVYALLPIVLASCGGVPKSKISIDSVYPLLKEGMTESDVKKIAGDPPISGKLGGSVNWTYFDRVDPSDQVHLEFENGRVTFLKRMYVDD